MKSFNEFREVQLDEARLSKMSTDYLQKHWDQHKDEERPAPAFAAHLKRVAAELAKRKKAVKEEAELEEGTVPAERNRPGLSSGDKDKLGKVASLMAKEKAKKDEDLPFTPDKPHKPVAKAGKYGSGYSTARHLARQGMKDVQKEEVELDEAEKDQDKHYANQSANMQTAINMHMRKGKGYWEAVRAAKVHVKEEVEQVDELDKSTLKSYMNKALDDDNYNKRKNRPADVVRAMRKVHAKSQTEEVESIDEISTAAKQNYINAAALDAARHGNMLGRAQVGQSKTSAKISGDKITKRLQGIATATSKLTKEESEDLQELSKGTLGSYVKKASTQAVTAGLTGMAQNAGSTPKANQPEAGSKAFAVMRKREAGVKKAVDKLTKEETEMSQMDQYLAAISGNADFRGALEEKKLTPAEMKKREEVAQAIERENPDMPMDKKMAIATATAKKVAEEKEGDTPDNEKEKSLAKLAKPYDKVTHADVLKGRGVTKEGVEMKTFSQLMQDIAEAKGGDYGWDHPEKDEKPASTTRKIAGTRYGGSAQKDEPEEDEDDKPAEKRGRGRPAGSKSGARH